MSSSHTIIWCLIALGTLNAAHGATLRYYNGSVNNYISTPLNAPLAILPYLNKTVNTTFYTHGFTGKANGTDTLMILSAYIDRGDTNVVLLDWEQEATGYLPNILGYPLAVTGAKEIARQFGVSLVSLIGNGILPNLIRLIGHSLGAHLMGWAGQKVQESNYNLSRITGLDPAGPEFGEIIDLNGLSSSQAQTVVALHSNPGQYGDNMTVGLIDFWANCNDGRLQPGCPDGIYFPLTPNSVCSHLRAVDLYTEAILNPSSFPAVFANNCSAWSSQNSSTGTINYLGDNADPSEPGNFYFATKAQYPYSEGEVGLRPN